MLLNLRLVFTSIIQWWKVWASKIGSSRSILALILHYFNLVIVLKRWTSHTFTLILLFSYVSQAFTLFVVERALMLHIFWLIFIRHRDSTILSILLSCVLNYLCQSAPSSSYLNWWLLHTNWFVYLYSRTPYFRLTVYILLLS